MNLVIMVPPWGPGALEWQALVLPSAEDSRRRGGTQRALMAVVSGGTGRIIILLDVLLFGWLAFRQSDAERTTAPAAVPAE